MIWFVDGPDPVRSYGQDAGPRMRFVAEPDDGGHVWAVVEQPLAGQEVEHPDAFAAIPEALLHSLAYWLDLAGLRQPPELAAVLTGDPAVAASYPLGAGLVTVDDMPVLAARRTLGPLDVSTTLWNRGWLAAVCPAGTQAALRSVGSEESAT